MNTVLNSLKKFWGYDTFLPLQQKAIESVLNGRDSIVVLPTGGGKSLCFQAPAVSSDGYAIVVSPLISLMKDQVDALAECGISAARIDSSLPYQVHQSVLSRLRQGQLKILYVSPERLVSESFLDTLRENPPRFVAIDEAHCVSMWGHDFRPEYRQLSVLKKSFPKMAIHAYTATATRQVRDDIAVQLGLSRPEIHIGFFDRPNLFYKVESRQGNGHEQIARILRRHKGESGIIYCIRRKDVDKLCEWLGAQGFRAAPYHAGMEDQPRKLAQEAFISEDVDIIVATVAFGMGIDKSNVRYVIHAGMPKSLEHYQQESGRAGRDGLEAECALLYSGGDYGVWKSIMRDMEPEPQKIAFGKLSGMYDYCSGAVCRHDSILSYFGQSLEKDNCYACDICLGEMEQVPDSLVTAQKILSCVVRLREERGADYVASVLLGSTDHGISEAGHHELSTFGLLKQHPKEIVRSWIGQLASQKHLERNEETHALSVTEAGWQALRGKAAPRLFVPSAQPDKSLVPSADTAEAKKKLRRAPEQDSWEGVDEGLFEKLRELRLGIAREKNLPPYVVFSDAALRDMARKRPASRAEFLQIKGVGEKKAEDYEDRFLFAIRTYCVEHSLAFSIFPAEEKPADRDKAMAIALSREGKSVREIARSIDRAESAVREYLRGQE